MILLLYIPSILCALSHFYQCIQLAVRQNTVFDDTQPLLCPYRENRFPPARGRRPQRKIHQKSPLPNGHSIQGREPAASVLPPCFARTSRCEPLRVLPYPDPVTGVLRRSLTASFAARYGAPRPFSTAPSASRSHHPGFALPFCTAYFPFHCL